MDQAKKCPFCARRIGDVAEVCPSCGSHVIESVSDTPADTERKRPRRFSIGHAVGLAIVLTYIFVKDLLPEGVTQWVDWFIGKDKPFKPGWILVPVLLLFFVIIGLIEGYVNPDERALRGRSKLAWIAVVLTAVIGLLIALTIYYPDPSQDLVERSRRGDVKQVRNLVNNGADVNARDRHGMTALMWASSEGDLEVVGILLDWGADVNATGGLGLTAVHMASVRGHTQIVELLRGRGAKE